MRVTTGVLKGKNLKFFSNKNIRPTADIVKQALFARLFDVKDKTFLDLFCGCGQIGIEALSRGAKPVCFVDKGHDSINLTLENLKGLENATIKKADFKVFLKTTNQTFDIIYIDPPYKSNYYEIALKIIRERNLLNENGTIICEHNKAETINQAFFKVSDIKFYGIRALTFLN